MNRWGNPGKGNDDFSQYLRQSTAPTTPNAPFKTSLVVGNMNTVGTTLHVGKPRHDPKRNFSEPPHRNRAHRLSHSRSQILDKDRDRRAEREKPHIERPLGPVQMNVWFHEYASYTEDVVVDPAAFEGLQLGNVYELRPATKNKNTPNLPKLTFKIGKENVLSTSGAPGAKAKPNFQISLNSTLQKLLDIPPRAAVQIQWIPNVSDVELDTVEIYLKDVNFSRDSQWGLMSTLVRTCCYVDQRVTFMGERIGSIKTTFKNGKKCVSGYIGENTSITFRSESAKLVFLVQLSREMWHFEENGEIMFHKLVNTLFPMIFKKWRQNNAHHSITIVLFTTVDLTQAPWINLGAGERPSNCQDYYRVVVDQVSVFNWDRIMANLRLEFANFKRDILLQLDGQKYQIKGEPCPSVKGNLLEAINMSLTLVSDRYKNSDLRHSIHHMIVVSPGTGLFDVDYDQLLETSKRMFSLDCALDILCLSQPPLHTVPLFRYRSDDGTLCHCVPKWCDMSFYAAATNSPTQWIPRCKIYELQMMGLMENELSEIQLARIKFKRNVPITESMDAHDEAIFRPANRKPLVSVNRNVFDPAKVPVPGVKNVAMLSLMNKANMDRLAGPTATHVSTTNSSVNGLVTNTSMANSALTSLYTLNKAGDDKNTKQKSPATASSSEMQVTGKSSLSELSSLSNPSTRASKFETDAKRPPRPLRVRNRDAPEHIGAEKRPSAAELEQTQREENNPYWMSVNNPSQPQQTLDSQCSRWADVFPPKIRRRMFKWRSLKAPAALPIGTTLFPTSSEMESDYTFQIYVVTLNFENRLELGTTRELMREMIRLRLAMGFQICYGDRVKRIEAQRKSGGYPEGIIKYFPSGDCTGTRIYLSLNDEIHRIFYDYNGSLNVQLYRKVEDDREKKISLGSRNAKNQGRPLIRTRYADEYTPTKVKTLNCYPTTFNWNQFDQLLAGYEDAIPESNKEFYKMKFVIIPTEVSSNAYHINNEKLNDEEIRLEGLRKLIALIERGKYQPNEKKDSRKKEEVADINFYTGNLHDFLNEQAEYFDISGTKPTNSLMITDGSRFNKNIKISQLAEELQKEGGIKLTDRTWHFKLHAHCFLGSDLVSWLIKSFEDIDNIESAVEYGQSLMDRKLFYHSENRHGFLDGHYFYLLNDEYVDPSYKAKANTMSWFRKKTAETEDKKESRAGSATPTSAPNTPLTGAVNTPEQTRQNSVSSNAADTPSDLRKVVSSFMQPESEVSSLSDSQKLKKKKKFLITKHIKYNCDPSGKSFRHELIDVHYDTVHNPEHCYHIRLKWLNTTTKFIDETIINWSRLCERHGLKLIETPWSELCTIPESNPFHSFIDLKLAVNPLTDPEFKDTEILKTNKFYFHLHFLKVVDFLLDNRGTSFFSKDNIEVCYSWGKSSFKFAQFIHKTGLYIVELRDNGEFFMAPNNVHILRVNTLVTSISDQSGRNNILDTQKVMLKFREGCKDEDFLRRVFRDAKQYLKEDYNAAFVIGM